VSTPVAPATSAPTTTDIPLADVRAVVAARPADVPAPFAGLSPAAIESVWIAWRDQQRADVRARLERGGEDSLVNFWRYGTSFTRLPRATTQYIATRSSDRAEDLLIARLNDLVIALASSTDDERRQVGRQVLARHGIDPRTAGGQDRARVYLIEARARMIGETERYRQASAAASRLGDPAARVAAYATVYHDRGLSSDTSLRAGFAVDAALAELHAKGRLGASPFRRVAIVGPGLDFTDKAEGYDFYPQQSIQPFAVIDSLMRLGLAQPHDLRVTTFDVNPRVNAHLSSLRSRATGGYVLQVPLDPERPSHPWHPALVRYWETFGDRIGDAVAPMAPAPGTEGVRVRAIRIRRSIAESIVPIEMNIVLERLDHLGEADRFDLVIATNVLVYYDGFGQSLALANIASMLRPGGFFLTNYAVAPSPPIEPTASQVTPVFFDRQQQNGDTLFSYQRK
jgi:SAM-dependent methyltransferase